MDTLYEPEQRTAVLIALVAAVLEALRGMGTGIRPSCHPEVPQDGSKCHRLGQGWGWGQGWGHQTCLSQSSHAGAEHGRCGQLTASLHIPSLLYEPELLQPPRGTAMQTAVTSLSFLAVPPKAHSEGHCDKTTSP